MTEPVSRNNEISKTEIHGALPAKSAGKTDGQKIVDAIMRSRLVGLQVALNGKIDNSITVQELDQMMHSYLSIKKNKITVDSELLAHINFPTLSTGQKVKFLENILENILEIENPKTQAVLAKTLLEIMEEHLSSSESLPPYSEKELPEYSEIENKDTTFTAEKEPPPYSEESFPPEYSEIPPEYSEVRESLLELLPEIN